MLDRPFRPADSHCLHCSIGKLPGIGLQLLLRFHCQIQYFITKHRQNHGKLAPLKLRYSVLVRPIFIDLNSMTTKQSTDSPMSHVYELGKVTVFYIPSHKLDDPRYFHGSQTARMVTHEFLMHRYRAYTQSPTPVKGYWVDPNGQLVHDVMERFEVSFGSEAEFERLIEFLIDMCDRLTEDAIYVTRGERSFLIQRKATDLL